MSTFLLIPIACIAAMAGMTALLSLFFPAHHRPWWHALDRQAAAPASLALVETPERRALGLPFVGRDRRRAEPAAGVARRDGTRG
jgi:hypothetical protein